VTDREAEVRLRIMRAFADTGAPPALAPDDRAALDGLAARHVVALSGDPAAPILMAHPFAAHRTGARVASAGRAPGEWWGNCAWDGLGIVGLLDLADATVESNGVTLHVRDGALVETDVLFHVAVPARAWWDDIGFT
jgi:Alkylmercury lyase